jgi:hypothetical protein
MTSNGDDANAKALLRKLSNLRRIFEWKCSGLDAAGTNATAAASSLTLGGLLKHLALVEDDYFTVRLLGRPLPSPWDAIDLSELADWAWKSAADDTPDELLSLWRSAVARSEAAVAEAMAAGGSDQPVMLRPSDPPAPLRQILLDMIEEYARHSGHADIIRESIDGLVGEDPPR